VFLLGVMSLLIGITTVILAIAARLGDRFTVNDAMDIATLMLIGGVCAIWFFYRRILRAMVRAESFPVWRVVLITVLVLNFPVYFSALQTQHGRVFWVAGEEWLFILGYAVLGLCFSVGYAMTYRPAATYDPKTIHLVTD
jgi:hypothetical protein